MAARIVFLLFSLFHVSSEALGTLRASSNLQRKRAQDGNDHKEFVYKSPERMAMEMTSFDQISNAKTLTNKVVNVEDYGARGGGVDDTMAFDEAWKAACSSTSPISLVIPKGKTYLLKPIAFHGPCKSHVSVMIKGTIEASSNPSDWVGKNPRTWILFYKVNNLAVLGGGTIDGNGKVWWKRSCKIDPSQPCKDAPTALYFYGCNGLRVESLNVKNSQQIHIVFEESKNVTAKSIKINAPSNSPNTDGIHITSTQNITITQSTIATGDDCISIVSGSQDVKATNITCGPGHGISIGSLGANGSSDQVSGVIVDNALFIGTTNGVRIKTWQGGRGYAKNIQFKNIKMSNVKNPIIIDQSYCDSLKPCPQQESAVQVSNVQYSNIKGTIASNFAINFNCSKVYPCKDITLQGIDLVRSVGGLAKSFCANAEWGKKGTVNPPPCA